ncbi:MAG TPA: hypothetical protein VMV87_13035 [Burkholderiales bacterium]|nr:hypothetical protein [Burkholderiales bacterium]
MRRFIYVFGVLACLGIIAGVFASRPTETEGLRKSTLAARVVYLMWQSGDISQAELSAVREPLLRLRAAIAAEPEDDLDMQLGGYINEIIDLPERATVNRLFGMIAAQDLTLAASQQRYMQLLVLDGMIEAVVQVEQDAP